MTDAMPRDRDDAPAERTSGESETAGAPTKPIVSFEDFARLDLRVARVVEAGEHSNADRLLRLKLDDGSGVHRQVCAGIKGHYRPEDLVGRLIVIVANLEPRKIRGEESRGMLLAASETGPGDEPRRVVLLAPADDVRPGAVVS